MTETPTPSTGSYVQLALGSTSYFCFLFAWFSLPAFLAPVIVDLSLSNTQAGILAGAIPLTYIPVALWSGLIIDRVGARRAIAAGLLLIGAGQAARGVALDFWTALGLTLVMGVGGTGITFGLPKLVSELFPPERSGTMSAVYLVGSSLGTAAAFGIGRPVLGPLLGGWRPLFVLSGAVVMGYAVVWIVASRWLDPPRYDDRTDDERAFAIGSIKRDIAAVFSSRGMRLLVIVGLMQLFVSHGLQAWLPTVLEARGVPAATAAIMASVLVVARITGTITIPPISDLLGTRRWVLASCGALCTAGVVGLLVTGRATIAIGAVVVLVGLGLGGLSPLIRAIPIELEGVGPRLTGTATGLIFAIGEVGGFSGPFLVGALQDATGTYTAGLVLLVGGSVVIIAAGLAMRETAAADGSASTST